MLFKKTLVLSSVNGGNEKAVINFEKEKIWLPWTIVDYNHRIINFTNVIYPIIIFRTENKQEDGSIEFIDRKISYKLCNETSMSNLDKNTFIINEDLGKFYCINCKGWYCYQCMR